MKSWFNKWKKNLSSQILHLQIHLKHFIKRLTEVLQLQVPLLEPVHLINDLIDFLLLNL